MKRPASILILTLCLLFAVHPAAAKDTWTSVRSQNFFLVGNASEKEIRQVATRLEQFRDAFGRLFKRARLSDSVPTTVVVFKNMSAYKPFNPRGSAGYFQSGEDVNYITLTAERHAGEENPFGIIFHEYMHLLVKNNVSPNAPPWLNEGLAEFYSTLEVKGGDKSGADIGKPISHHVYYLREQKQLPLRTLLAVDHSSPHYNEKSKRGVFYAQSWALVHYLMLGKERQRAPQLSRYLNLIANGTSPAEGFKQVFEADTDAIEKELRGYIRRDSYPYVSFPFEGRVESTAEMQSAAITEAAALGYLGDLALHTRLLDQAEAHLQKAVAFDPQSATVQASLGMLRMRQQRFAEAKEHLRQAVAADARNHLALYYYAFTLSREAMTELGFVSSYTAEAAAAMRSALRKAIELKPDFPESYRLLAFVSLVTGEQLDDAAMLIKRALTLAPGNQEYALVLAQIHLRQEKFDDARRLVEPLARNADDPQTRAGAQSLLNAVSNIQEQAARFKAMRDAAATAESVDGGQSSNGSDRQAPRLRRLDEGGVPTNIGKTEEELVAEALSQAIQEALRKPEMGETRVRGLLTRIECGLKGITFHVKTGDRLLKLNSPDFNSLHLMAYTQEAGGELTCGPRKTESAAVFTYRPSKDARAKADGEMVALEFVPASFVLKQ